MIDDPGAVVRRFIADGMRHGIKDRALLQHVVMRYTRKAALTRALNITSQATV